MSRKFHEGFPQLTEKLLHQHKSGKNNFIEGFPQLTEKLLHQHKSGKNNFIEGFPQLTVGTKLIES